MLLENHGISAGNIERFVLAHGSMHGGRWFGGVIFKDTYGRLVYLAYRPDGDGVDLWRGQHELDFPELPETVDRDPFLLNEWLAEVQDGGG